MSLIKEFKEFAMRGNVMDMAVGVIMGGAFGKIVSSLVNDVLMPPLGYAIGGLEFKQLKHTLPPMEAKMPNPMNPTEFIPVMVKDPDTGEMVKKMLKVDIMYGSFVQSIVDFLIIAICIFLMIKAMNYVMKKKEEAPAAPPEPAADVKLLTEIRDLLAKR